MMNHSHGLKIHVHVHVQCITATMYSVLELTDMLFVSQGSPQVKSKA